MADEPAEFWGELGIDPVEIALPGGVGYTLRAYRAPDTVTGTDISERVAEEDPFAAKTRRPGFDEDEVDEEDLPPIDEDELAAQALAAESDDETYSRYREQGGDTALDLAPVASGGGESAAEDEKAGPELDEVPVFLSHKGRLLLFKSTEGLVSFVKSKAPNDLSQLPEWASLVRSVTPAHIEPSEDDTYELDLVVENLRGGHDAWDPDLVLSAGEVARDVAYALQLDSVLSMLSPGTPLDELDDALRAASGGGFGGFMAKRRVKKIGAQQASLGWRTVIGKISSSVDWRD